MEKYEDKLNVDIKKINLGNLSTWIFGIYNKKAVGLYFTIFIHLTSSTLTSLSM